jgi:hypothetical protein
MAAVIVRRPPNDVLVIPLCQAADTIEITAESRDCRR